MQLEWRHGRVAGGPESTQESVEDGLVRTAQELGLRRSGECSSKEKRCVRNLGMRMKRTPEVKGTNKQTRQPSKGSHRAPRLPSPSDRKACGEVATATSKALSKMTQMSRNAR